MDKPRVLVVDDEAAIRDYLTLGLQYEGFLVHQAADAGEARAAASAWRPHAAVLDVMMPGEDGFHLAKDLRAGDPALVIVFLTAKDAVDDRVAGIEIGADDYLVKPFAFRELVARLRRHLRRQAPALSEVLRWGEIELDPAAHRASLDGRPLELTVREFDLLQCLLQHPGQALSKRTLLDRVWGYDFYGDDNVVEVYVRYLREKLGDGDRRLIQTVRGIGYRLGG
ncbi:MAG TPA: response regulator transcription factor [Bacillota bacterium]|nr:response regulator transcription factor [Bacillota bacterium]